MTTANATITRHQARPAARPAPARNSMLAQIHIAKAQLGMCDETYRAMLWGVGRVKSAAELDHAGREKVLAHLRASGFKPKPGKSPSAHAKGRPRNMAVPERAALLAKVEALLASAQRPWAYADGLAKRMFGLDALAFCAPDQLH